nr:hypothetical protein AUSP0088_00012 [uncultured phage]
MYIGVNAEAEKKVLEEDSFSYACERCRAGDLEMKETFLEIAKHSEDMENFAETLIEWFYSGNWIKEENYDE